MKRDRRFFSKLATINLVYLLFVICFGAYVRMTGSGAGCGNHWPLCNGEFVPRAPLWQTVIEFSHRLTSGGLVIFCLALCYFCIKIFPKKHLSRFFSFFYFFLLIVESLLGAFLVKFEHVAQNKSIYRGFSVSFHLINTFLLVFAAGGILYFVFSEKVQWKSDKRKEKGLLFLGAFLMIFVGLSGAITALGDTLFPATGVWDALLRSQSTAEHVFVRLRVYHPFLAIFTSLFLMSLCFYLKDPRDRLSEKSAKMTTHFLGTQLFLGYMNVFFHAPYFLQLVHLLVAVLSWLSYCFFSARVLILLGK